MRHFQLGILTKVIKTVSTREENCKILHLSGIEVPLTLLEQRHTESKQKAVSSRKCFVLSAGNSILSLLPPDNTSSVHTLHYPCIGCDFTAQLAVVVFRVCCRPKK